MFFAFGLNSQGQTKKIITAILFSATEDGIWINWIGVSSLHYDSKFFGKKSTGKSFCQCGLGSFMILLAQIQSFFRMEDGCLFTSKSTIPSCEFLQDYWFCEN